MGERIFFTVLLALLLVPIGILLPLSAAYAGFYLWPGLWSGWEVLIMVFYCIGAPVLTCVMLWKFWREE